MIPETGPDNKDPGDETGLTFVFGKGVANPGVSNGLAGARLKTPGYFWRFMNISELPANNSSPTAPTHSRDPPSGESPPLGPRSGESGATTTSGAGIGVGGSTINGRALGVGSGGWGDGEGDGSNTGVSVGVGVAEFVGTGVVVIAAGVLSVSLETGVSGRAAGVSAIPVVVVSDAGVANGATSTSELST